MVSVVARLHDTITALSPIRSLRVAVPGDSESVEIDFAPEATPAQRAGVLAAVAAFDWSSAAQTAWDRDREPFLRDLIDDAQTRIAQIDTYLAIASPTNAQVAAEFRRSEIAERRIIEALVRLIVREWRS